MEIKVVLISTLSSEILASKIVQVPEFHLSYYSDVHQAIHLAYPTLLQDDYQVYCRYSKEDLLEIIDYISYITFLIYMADKTLYVLLKDQSDDWIDNGVLLEIFDIEEALEEKERNRDPYDVRIVTKGVLDEEELLMQALAEAYIPCSRPPRKNDEIIFYAFRKETEPVCYTVNEVRLRKLLEDVKRGKYRYTLQIPYLKVHNLISII